MPRLRARLRRACYRIPCSSPTGCSDTVREDLLPAARTLRRPEKRNPTFGRSSFLRVYRGAWPGASTGPGAGCAATAPHNIHRCSRLPWCELLIDTAELKRITQVPGARLETVVVLTSNRRSRPPRLQSGSVFRERNMTLLRFTAFLCFITTSTPVFAQQYPARPIRILIPFTAGSAADIIGRA